MKKTVYKKAAGWKVKQAKILWIRADETLNMSKPKQIL